MLTEVIRRLQVLSCSCFSDLMLLDAIFLYNFSLLTYGHMKATAYLGLTSKFQTRNREKVYKWKVCTSHEAKMQTYL